MKKFIGEKNVNQVFWRQKLFDETSFLVKKRIRDEKSICEEKKYFLFFCLFVFPSSDKVSLITCC